MKQIERYLELLKKSLINTLYIENEVKITYLVRCLMDQIVPDLKVLVNPDEETELTDAVKAAKETGGVVTMMIRDEQGVRQPAHHLRNYIEFPHSMIGQKRMDNLQYCIETVLAEDVPGDLIETGVWRGGATVFMRGVLAAHEVEDRTVWVADSFEGLPVSSLQQDQDVDLSKDKYPVLSVGLDKVKDLFARYDLLDDQVRFLKGWFKDTLMTPEIQRLSVLRLDGDLYESTMDALMALYDKVSIGGFIIVDDYNALDACKAAVEDFRHNHHITDEMIKIDWMAVYWRKSGEAAER